MDGISTGKTTSQEAPGHSAADNKMQHDFLLPNMATAAKHSTRLGHLYQSTLQRTMDVTTKKPTGKT